jgi:hypothetical protein
MNLVPPMNRLNRYRLCSRASVKLIALVALTSAVVAVSCESRPLIVVDVTSGDSPFTSVNLHLAASGTSKTYAGATFTSTVSFKVGLYLPAGTSGTVEVVATTDDGTCVTGTGSVLIPGVAPGATAPETTLFTTHTGAGACVPIPGTGGKSGSSGTGGAAGGGGPGGNGAGGGIIGGSGGSGVGGGIIVGSGGSGVGGAIIIVGTGGHGVGGATGTGGATVVGTGGATVVGTGGTPGGDPGCGIVHCPSSLPNCCTGWFAFELDPAPESTSRPELVGTLTDTTTLVSDNFTFEEESQVGALGFDLSAGLDISQLGIKASYTSGVVMPIYASFESSDGSEGCLYALNLGGYIQTTTPVAGSCRGGFPGGYAQKINIRMDSLESGYASMSITELDIVP